MEQQKQVKVFSVVMLRSDVGQVEVHATQSSEEANKVHKELTQAWAQCVRDQTPFVIETPILDAFPPNVIQRLYVEELTLEEWNMRQNPYNQQAENEGFSATLNKYFTTK